MVQNIIIALLFAAALGYLIRLVYNSFRTRSCSSGCGSCSIDFDKLEKDLEKKGVR